MDVAREIEAANRRVRRVIEARTDEAYRRIGVDPDQVRAEERARAFREIGEALGTAARAVVDLLTPAIAAASQVMDGLGLALAAGRGKEEEA